MIVEATRLAHLFNQYGVDEVTLGCKSVTGSTYDEKCKPFFGLGYSEGRMIIGGQLSEQNRHPQQGGVSDAALIPNLEIGFV